MIDKLRAAITALNYGEQLTHPAIWKQRQNLVNALVALLGAVAIFLPDSLRLSNEDVMALAGAVGVLAGLFNNYLTTATTTKVGLPPQRINPDDPGP